MAVYGAGTLDNLLAGRADRVAMMMRQLPKVLEYLYGLGMSPPEPTLEQEGCALIEQVKQRMGR